MVSTSEKKHAYPVQDMRNRRYPGPIVLTKGKFSLSTLLIAHCLISATHILCLAESMTENVLPSKYTRRTLSQGMVAPDSIL